MIASIALGVSGPFGSFAAVGLWPRLFNWSLLVAVGMVTAMSVRVVLRLGWRPQTFWRGAVATAFWTSILATAPNWWLAKLLFGKHAPSLPSLPVVVAFTFAISIIISALRSSLEGPWIAPDEAPQSDPAEDMPRILRRLDAAEPGRLVAMTVRDHYVDVLTTAGRSAVLMRFSDAMAEAGPEEGVQVHRSHWVAWWAVRGVQSEGAKLFVLLDGERRLPVSKSHRAKLEERGFLPAAAE